MKLVQLFGVTLLVALFVLSGCGGGGSSSSPSPGTISGVVADGYLVGATVFSDRDGDKVWDEGEPKTETAEGGAYTLTGVDIDKYPVVVLVEPDVVDEDTGTPVGQEYILAAPPEKPQFISPITTIIQQQIEADPSLEVDEAEDRVKAQLGVSDAADLFENFIEPNVEGLSAEEAAALQAESEKMHKVAQVVARTFGDMKEEIETVAEAAGVDLSDNLDVIVTMVVDRVMEQLDVIALSVDESIAAEETFSPEDLAEETLTAIQAGEEAITVENIEQEVEVSETVVEESAWTALISDGGVFWFEFDQDYDEELQNYVLDVEYGHVQPLADGSIDEDGKSYDFATCQWVTFPDTNSRQEYVLVNGEWIAVSDGPSEYTVALNADGTATLSHAELGADERIAITAIDLSGKKIAYFVEDEDVFEYFADPAAIFPAGSKGYRMTFTALSDIYEVQQWTDDDQPDYDYNFARYWDCPEGGGECSETQLTSMSQVRDVFAAEEGNDNKYWFGGLALQFGADNSIVVYRDYEDWVEGQRYYVSERLDLTGTLREETFQEQTLYFIDLPAEYSRYIDWNDGDSISAFLVEMDGGVKLGEFSPAGAIDSDEGFNFNETAFNAIKDNLAFCGGGDTTTPPVESIPITTEMVSGQTFLFVDAQSESEFELISLQADGSLVIRGREWDDLLMQDVDYSEVGTWTLSEGVVTGEVGGGAGTVALVEAGADAITIFFSEVGGQDGGPELWQKTVPFIASDLIGNSYSLSEGQTMTFTDDSNGQFTEQQEVMPFTWSLGEDGMILAVFTSPEGSMTRTIMLVAGGTPSSFQIAGFGGDGEMFEVFTDTLMLLQ